MWKEIKLIKSLYSKEAILYTISLYLDESPYEIGENESEYIIKVGDMEDAKIVFFKQELNFNNLRFLIANENKDLRKTIITKALGSINID